MIYDSGPFDLLRGLLPEKCSIRLQGGPFRLCKYTLPVASAQLHSIVFRLF